VRVIFFSRLLSTETTERCDALIFIAGFFSPTPFIANICESACICTSALADDTRKQAIGAEQALNIAAASLPGGHPLSLSLPESEHGVYSISLKTSAVWESEVNIDAYSGKVLQCCTPIDATMGDHFPGWLFPLHTERAFGLPKRIFILYILYLNYKISMNNGKFSTQDLSQGQRKCLALLIVYLENRPFYIFDEWAADQDPELKELFYTELLPALKAKRKTVPAITHDDRYFSFGGSLHQA